MLNSPLKKSYLKPVVVVNNKGVRICYIRSKVTSVGGGTYITRALALRNETQADVIVFMIPNGDNAAKNRERINRGREDLAAAVRPLILPFKITTVITDNQKAAEMYFSNLTWNEITY